MKKYLYIGLSVMIVLLIFAGCAKPPTEKIEQAKKLLEKAEQLKAKEYAPKEYKTARETLDKTLEAVKNKKFSDAKEFAIKAIDEANIAIDATKKKMKLVKDEAKKAVTLADSLIMEVNEEYKGNKKFQETIDKYNAVYEEAKNDFNSENFLKARKKAMELNEKIQGMLQE